MTGLVSSRGRFVASVSPLKCYKVLHVSQPLSYIILVERHLLVLQLVSVTLVFTAAMELLDPRLIQVNASQPTSFCRFGGPDLVNIVSGTIRPTFAIEPTNTASLDVTGSFTQTDG